MAIHSEAAFSPESDRAVESVQGLLNYIAASGERPVYYAYEPPPGTPRQTGQFAPHPMSIRNGRTVHD